MEVPWAPTPAFPASQLGFGGRGVFGLCLVAASASSADTSSYSSYSSSSAATAPAPAYSTKPGTGPSGVVRVAEGGGSGEGRFVPRSRSQNRVRLVPAVFSVPARGQWGWVGAAQPREAEAAREAEMS